MFKRKTTFNPRGMDEDRSKTEHSRGDRRLRDFKLMSFFLFSRFLVESIYFGNRKSKNYHIAFVDRTLPSFLLAILLIL